MNHSHHKNMKHEQGHMNMDGHEGHDHGSTFFINKWVTNTINISLFIMAIAFLITKLVNPSGDIKFIMHPIIWIILSSIIIFTTGFKYFKVYKQLFVEKKLSVNLLMAFAAHTMYIYSIVISVIGLIDKTPFSHLHVMWPAIIFIIALMDIGHIIEGKLNKSSQSGFDKLKKLQQRIVHVIRDGKIVDVEADDVKIGETILVKKNEIVPLDGILMSNSGEFDTSNITGESNHSSLVAGKYVISGSLNAGINEVKVRINKNSEDSTITRIIKKIQDSTMKLTNSQKAIDKFVNIIIPIVFLIAIGTFIVWIILTNLFNITTLPWSNAHGKIAIPFDATFAVLDIAAPCALGMAIPLLIMVSSYIGATNSIVFNSIKTIDTINDVKIVAFDKTGTITEDRFKIVNIEGDQKLLNVVKGLEENLNHPIAKSLYEYIDVAAASLQNIKQIAGKGVEATYKGKKVYLAKSEEHKKDSNLLSTFISLYIDKKEILSFELQPKIKLNAKKVIAKLKAKNIKVVMITGDNKNAAKAIADKVGIDYYYAETSPEQKLEIVKKLQNEGKTMYIGDGFNDLAASKQADVSVAFASGDDILNDLTDISLITNDLNVLLKLFNLSRMNTKASKFSIISVFSLSFALIPLAMLLIIPPFAAVIIMIFVDILVVWNAWFYKTIGTKKIMNI